MSQLRRVGWLVVALTIFVGVFGLSKMHASTDEFLKFHWAFNEGSGTTAGDSSGNITTYPGTTYNGPTWIPGGGLSFDGIDDYARTDSAIPNSMGVTDQGYTLSASVRLADQGEDGNIIHISNGSNGVGWCIAMLHVESGHFRAIGWNNGSVIAVDPTEATAGQWYSIANTWSPDTHEMDLYVNGALVASTPMEHFTAADEPVYIFAGLNPGGCDNNHGWFKGDIKDVRIYSRAISQTEAQQNSDASIALSAESFSPVDDATSVGPSATLSITFGTSTVATSTGSIGIYKTADDSLVESFLLDSTHIARTNTTASTTFTISPSSNFTEGVGYYVWIPGTVFADGTGTFYAGTSASTTWNFSVPDVTAPIISNLATSSLATTSATIAWTTNEVSSTRLWYSADTAYASSTDETNTGTRVMSHSVSLSDLVGCTLYHYRAVSRDASANSATSTDASFTTTGCSGGAIPSSSTSTAVIVSSPSTNTLTDSSRTLSVVTPANFTATSSSVVIQIKAMPSTTVLGAIGTPSNSLSSAATIVFDVTALIDNMTTLDSFDLPVTVSYTYTDADVAGLDESTLTMYHYHNGAWLPLNSCSVNTSTNTITCTSPSFSTFAIFGSPTSTGSSPSTTASGGSLPWCSGPSAPGWNTSLPNGGCGKVESVIQTRTLGARCPSYKFTRELRLGMQGEDVRSLQKLMNCLGYTLGTTGPGSPGKETTLFRDRTYVSVKKFQEAYATGILAPLKATKGTGIFGVFSRTQASKISVK
jgi:hypothetical protein